ncbi:dinitrogenase iron-molybdenum cofactor family protein, partial [Vibrio parahaemolyticus V-223/04]
RKKVDADHVAAAVKKPNPRC